MEFVETLGEQLSCLTKPTLMQVNQGIVPKRIRYLSNVMSTPDLHPYFPSAVSCPPTSAPVSSSRSVSLSCNQFPSIQADLPGSAVKSVSSNSWPRISPPILSAITRSSWARRLWHDFALR
jgi:hypothetical protein